MHNEMVPKNQFTTWAGHLFLALTIPALVSFVIDPIDRLFMASWISTAVLVIFMLREWRDMKLHDADGEWDEHHHMDEYGVVAKVDMVGDLLGPVSVTVTYWVAWALTLI